MQRSPYRRVVLLSILTGYLIAQDGQLALADIFGSHMVLQSDQPLPVWGSAAPGQRVTVSFHDQHVSTQADAGGVWRVRLQSEPASAIPMSLLVQADQTLTCSDVLVGEVWYASGQSNMALTMAESAGRLAAAREALAHADHPLLRYRHIAAKFRSEAQPLIGDGCAWSVCQPDTAAAWSAVCFSYAVRLAAELAVPIGIIESAWGGHPIEPFIPASAFVGSEVLERECALARSHDLAGLKSLSGGVFARDDSWLPGVIFNARVAPVAPYAIRGALWYQAESNCGTGEDPRFYRLKMAALIAGWRSAWERPDLPLYFVQLPQYNSPNWVWMRDEQRRAMVGPGVGMAVTIDLAPDGIHPANKIDVGERLALWPLGTVYGKPVPFSGPLFASADRNGSSIIVHFTHADGGLVRAHMVDLKPAEILVGDQIAGVEVCGQDRVWHPAGARIDHDALVCTCDQVPLLIGVRYAWASLCPGADGWNLANRSGLPASPFISDPALVAFALDQ